MHGTTTHGTQLVFSLPHSRDYLGAYLGAIGSDAPLHVGVMDTGWRDEQRQPRTYYHREGPIGRIMEVVQSRKEQPR